MISYYDISGCYILRPWSYKIWEIIQKWFDVEIQKKGVENSYFPLFVSQERLEKEKDHVEGFAPEVAWVTKSGNGDLAKPIAVRPTSETIMYPAFSDWIRSHRDLPLKLNQWSNVVRWEFKYPTPFLRTREFLWQEGHTAHSTFEEADEMVMDALDWYRRVYEELLAVPVVPGFKTEKEKFAGGFRTTTVEAYIAGSGRAIQGATSHNLGQNFGKMFDITFQNDKGETQVAWQTSWGLTTRTIGVMVMVHGDDQGLVIPPRVAPLQVVIVPVISKKFPADVADPYCQAIVDELKEAEIRAKYDDRDSYNAGWKYNHWEQKGVPIRLEVGPKDYENKAVRLVIRHDGSKEDVPVADIGSCLKEKLEAIQASMFAKAKEARDSHVVKVTEWKDFVPNLEKHNLVLTPWCGGEHEDWEDWVKKTSREESLKARGEDVEDEKTATSVAAKTLCIPFDQPELPQGTKCIASGMDATCWVLWGRSY
jgi:prolyl-tRNA synthetase